MLKDFWKNPSALAILLTIVVAGYAARQGFIEISLRPLESADLGTVFLTLIFTALVIERAVEVFVNNRYDPEEMQIERGIRAARQRLTILREELDAEVARDLPRGADAKAVTAAVDDKQRAVTVLRSAVEAARDKLVTEKVAALDGQIDLGTRKAAAAGAVATVLGVIAAAAGVRVLGQFLPMDESGVKITGPLAQTCAGIADTLTATTDTTAKEALIDSCKAAEWQLTAFRFADVLLTALLLAGGADGIHQLVKDFLSKKDDLSPTK